MLEKVFNEVKSDFIPFFIFFSISGDIIDLISFLFGKGSKGI